ncbi:MAG TPA: hypothetical protein VGR89_10350 [Puia sp.]|nr:hypothetical protein [Puia sp.]
MRTVLTILALSVFLSTQAQTHLLPVSGWGYAPWQPFVPYSAMTAPNPNHTFQLRPFSSVSAGYWFLGGGVSYLSAPIGLVLYRPVNNNFTAFGTATLAPTVFHVSSFYNVPLANPANNFTNFGVTAGVSGGLIYTNDARTFSISGSVSVERGSYPVYVPGRSNNSKRYQ